MPSCRSAPISLATWTAMRASVLPPTAGLGYFSCLNCPASPRLCGECGADIRGQRQRRDRLGYHTLCPDIGFECLPLRTQSLSPRCSPRSAPAASCHGRLLRPLPHSVDRHLPRRGHFVCCRPCHGLWCWDESHPTKRALPMAQSADCHSQSTPPSSSHPSTKTAQIRCSTPSSTQRWNVRWMVLSAPSSLGR